MLHGHREIQNFLTLSVHCTDSWNIFQHKMINFVSPSGHMLFSHVSIYIFIWNLAWCDFICVCTMRLWSRVIYNFSCAGCSTCYVGETNRHFATRIHKYLHSDKHSHVLKHIRGSYCCSLCSEECFKIFNSASTSFQLKIKEENLCTSFGSSLL